MPRAKLCNDFLDYFPYSLQVTSLRLSSDCVHVVVGCTDGNVYVYNLRSRELLETLSDQSKGPVNSIVISVDQHFLFSGGKVRQNSIQFTRTNPKSAVYGLNLKPLHW